MLAVVCHRCGVGKLSGNSLLSMTYKSWASGSASVCGSAESWPAERYPVQNCGRCLRPSIPQCSNSLKDDPTVSLSAPWTPTVLFPAACAQRVTVGILQVMSPCAIVTVAHRDLGTQEALLTESRLPRTELISWETVEEGTGGQVHSQALCLQQVSLCMPCDPRLHFTLSTQHLF